MTLPAGPAAVGLTDMDIDALTAPLGIELHRGWQSGALASVAMVRDSSGLHVEWKYTNGSHRYFKPGERVGVRVNLNDLRTAR